jgi:hypothetical protein
MSGSSCFVFERFSIGSGNPRSAVRGQGYEIYRQIARENGKNVGNDRSAAKWADIAKKADFS